MQEQQLTKSITVHVTGEVVSCDLGSIPDLSLATWYCVVFYTDWFGASCNFAGFHSRYPSCLRFYNYWENLLLSLWEHWTSTTFYFCFIALSISRTWVKFSIRRPWGFTTTEKNYYSCCSIPDNSHINEFLLSRHCAVNFRDGFNSQSVDSEYQLQLFSFAPTDTC